MAKKDFSVSIIGGGIGGLSLTIGLVRAGVPVDIFEAAVSQMPESMVRSALLKFFDLAVL